MASRQTQKSPTNRSKEQMDNDQREEELVEQIPDEMDAATERGERMATGKTIAEGGHPSREKERE